MKILTEDTFLFPYTVFPCSYYKFISLILPSAGTLSLINPIKCPQWDTGFLKVYELSLDEERSQNIKNIHRGYKEFAKIRGEEGLLETFSLKREDEEWEESRPQLKTLLKQAGSNERADFIWLSTVESIIFLELAKELDEKDTEVDKDMLQVRSLEDQFKETLGIEPEDIDEVEEPIKITMEALPPRSHFGYLTKQRISHWLRIYFAKLPFRVYRCNVSYSEENVQLGKKLPIIVCASRDVYEELTDPIRTQIEKRGKLWNVESIQLLTSPNIFETMDDKSFEIFRHSIDFDRVTFWEVLQNYINQPEESQKKALIEEAKKFQEAFNRATYNRTSQFGSFTFSIFYHDAFNLLKAWEYIDRTSYRLFEEEITLDVSPVPIMVMEEK